MDTGVEFRRPVNLQLDKLDCDMVTKARSIIASASQLAGTLFRNYHSAVTGDRCGIAMIFLWAASIFSPFVHATESLLGSANSDAEVICEPLPGALSLTEELEDALRFAVDPRESADAMQQLVEQRPEHLFAIALTLSLDGESYQKFDFSMVKVTAPAVVDQSALRDLVAVIASNQEAGSPTRLNLRWLWQRLEESHPVERVGVDWACLRAEVKESNSILMLLGHGLESCGVLERVIDLQEADALAASHGWTSVMLNRLSKKEVAIAETDLTAALFSINSLSFHD